MEPIGLNLIKGVWKTETASITGVRFNYETSVDHLRFLLSGLCPRDESGIPIFQEELIHIAKQALQPYRNEESSRELWAYLPTDSYLAEFVELTTDQIGEMGVHQVILLDNDSGCRLRVLSGRPPARETVPYHEMRSDTSILAVVKGIDLPRDFQRLSVPDLSETMRAIVKGALEVYEEWLLSLICFDDDGPRMALSIRANVPSGVTTVLVNLPKVAHEIEAGFTLENFKRAVDFIHY